MIVAPAPAGHGVRFSVSDAGDSSIALNWMHRAPSRLNTAIALPDGSKLRTIEHLAASLSVFGVDNALVTVEGREMPIFDGSAERWCACLTRAGIADQARPRSYIRVLRPVQVSIGDRFVRAEPTSELEIDVICAQFSSGTILRWAGSPTRQVFVEALSRSRSSGQATKAVEIALIERMRRAGLLRPKAGPGRSRAGRGQANEAREDLVAALAPDIFERLAFPDDEPLLRGARPGRAAVWIGPWVLGGRRFPDELVRHVALDLIGDLSLACAPLLGRIVANAPTHWLTYAFVATLMRDREAWRTCRA